MLPEPKGEPLPLELKPLFQRDGPDALGATTPAPRTTPHKLKNICGTMNI